MKAAEMYCIKMSDAHEDKALSKQFLFPLVDGISIRFLPLHFRARDAGRVTTCILQEAGSVGNLLAIRDALLYTPPQVDRSACRYVRKRIRTYADGTWRWSTFSFLAVSRPLLLSSSEKIIAQSSQCLAAYYDRRGATPLRFFYRVTRDHVDRAASPTRMSPLLFEQISLPTYTGPTDIQMYFSLLNGKGRTDNRRAVSHVVFALAVKIIFEGDQKKDGKRPKPVKPNKPKTRKQKPEREGDKEKQEENEPRTERLVLSIMRKPVSSHNQP